MNEPVVTVEHLHKRYGERDAVADVSFTIARGETFALLGPNGAGKSTTVEILEGHRTRSGGDVRVLGTDPASGGLDWRSRVGVVLQQEGERPNATAREELAHIASLYPHPRDVDEVIAAVGLDQQARTRIRRLSGGQQRRVDVALGIVGAPELLFLDEPTTGFDPEARRQFWALIRALRDSGTTILLTTHYLDEAAQLADRVGVIAGGRMIALGAVDEIGGPDARTPVVRWREQGMAREQRTHEPGTLVARLVAAADGEPEALEVVRPSLEDVYLGLLAEQAEAPTEGAIR